MNGHLHGYGTEQHCSFWLRRFQTLSLSGTAAAGDGGDTYGGTCL
jgi:hypothetical protein